MLEQLDGHLYEAARELRRPTDTDTGPLSPLDTLLGSVDPSTHTVADLFASKVAFVKLAERLAGWGFTMIDCQVQNDHLERFGATEIPRRNYLAALREGLAAPPRRGLWQRTLTPTQVVACFRTS